MLVIDGSYSMAYRPTDKSLFARAKELAARIVAESPRGDAFSLVLMASPPRVVLGPPAFEPAVVRRELDNLELTHAGADLPAHGRGRLPPVGEDRRRRSAAYGGAEVLLPQRPSADHLGCRNWTRRPWATFRRQSQALSQAASLVVIDLGQPEPKTRP